MTHEELYEYVVRCKLLRQEAIYNDFILDIKKDKCYIIGFSEKFYQKSFKDVVDIVIDGSLYYFDYSSVSHEIMNYNMKSFFGHEIHLNLIISNVKVFTPEFLCVEELSRMKNDIFEIHLLDTRKIEKNSFFNIGFKSLYAPKLFYMGEGSLSNNKFIEKIILPKCQSISFNDLNFLKKLQELELSKDYFLEDAVCSEYEGSIFDASNVFVNSNIFDILYDRFIMLNACVLFMLMYHNKSTKLCFKNLTNLISTKKDRYYLLEYRKRYFPICNKEIIFPNLVNLDNVFYHMKFSNLIDFSVLKKLYKNNFNGCIFEKLYLKNCESIEDCSFKSCKINILDLSGLGSLNTNSFKNCTVGTLIINNQCEIDEVEILKFTEKIIRV